MELRERGYTGGYTMLKMFVASLRRKELAAPIIRFETEPGEQMQVDYAHGRRRAARLRPRSTPLHPGFFDFARHFRRSGPAAGR
jgi:transposase